MRLLGVLYFMALGYALCATDLDQAIWDKACQLHDQYVRHVLAVSRKELT